MDENVEITEAGGLNHIELTAGIVSAYVSNNPVPSTSLPTLIATTYAALTGLSPASTPAASAIEKPTPAQIRKSITPDALISFIDGKPYKTMKRHLSGAGMTIEQYRERYGLPRDYPSTAASYSAQRSALAKSLGLGQQRRKASLKLVPKSETAPDVAPPGSQPRDASSRKPPPSRRRASDRSRLYSPA